MKQLIGFGNLEMFCNCKIEQTFGVKTFWAKKKILFLFRNMLILQTSDLILCYFKTPHLQDTNLTIFISACNYAAKIFKQQRINHLRIKLMSIPIFGLNFRRWQTCPFSTSISFRQLKKISIGLKWKIQIFFCVVQNY